MQYILSGADSGMLWDGGHPEGRVEVQESRTNPSKKNIQEIEHKTGTRLLQIRQLKTLEKRKKNVKCRHSSRNVLIVHMQRTPLHLLLSPFHSTFCS